MPPRAIALLSALLLALAAGPLLAQERHYYQQDFPIEEFAQRRATVFDRIGDSAIAVIQGAAETGDFNVFRQSNEFYYLSGIETSQAYLLLDGRTRKATLYLPHRDPERERNEGKRLSMEDAELVRGLTGVDAVRGVEALALDLVGTGLVRPPAPLLYTPLSPAETGTDSRDELLAAQARRASDPWDGRESREARFRALLDARAPQFEVRDLSPILDAMRTIKSPREIALIRRASRIAGEGIIEAMRATRPGVLEYQLDAAAKYVFHAEGARGDGYASIIGGGRNAYMGHYFRKADPLRDGDMVLMDYAPDYRHYTSDVTRMWPVNGTYTDAQRQLSDFILAYRDALFRHIRPGVTSDQVLDAAASDMRRYLAAHPIRDPAHRKAAEESLSFRGHFQHPVGMAVHDVGRVRGVPLQPGMVFTIDPMLWVHEEQRYVRMEDVVAVTANGAENLSAFVPASIDEIERTMREPGLVQVRP